VRRSSRHTFKSRSARLSLLGRSPWRGVWGPWHAWFFAPLIPRGCPIRCGLCAHLPRTAGPRRDLTGCSRRLPSTLWPTGAQREQSRAATFFRNAWDGAARFRRAVATVAVILLTRRAAGPGWRGWFKWAVVGLTALDLGWQSAGAPPGARDTHAGCTAGAFSLAQRAARSGTADDRGFSGPDCDWRQWRRGGCRGLVARSWA